MDQAREYMDTPEQPQQYCYSTYTTAVRGCYIGCTTMQILDIGPEIFFQMCNVSKVYGMYKQTKLLKFQHKEKSSIVLDSWTITSVLVYFQFQSQSLCFHAFQMSPKIISYFHKFFRKIITFL